MHKHCKDVYSYSNISRLYKHFLHLRYKVHEISSLCSYCMNLIWVESLENALDSIIFSSYTALTVTQKVLNPLTIWQKSKYVCHFPNNFFLLAFYSFVYRIQYVFIPVIYRILYIFNQDSIVSVFWDWPLALKGQR